MDYEKLLFDLGPILNCGKTQNDGLDYSNTELQNALKNHLDKLAVALRVPSNRVILKDSGVFAQLISSCCVVTSIELQSEIIRCLANAVVDNDDNRNFYIDCEQSKQLNEKLFVNVDNMVSNNQDDFEIGKRSIIFIRNLCLEEIPDTLCKVFISSFERLFFHIVDSVNAIMSGDTGLYLLVFEFYSDIVKMCVGDGLLRSSVFSEGSSLPVKIEKIANVVEHFASLVSALSDQFEQPSAEEENEDEDMEEPEELTFLVLSSQLLESFICIFEQRFDATLVLKRIATTFQESYHNLITLFHTKILNTDPWTYQSFLDLMRKLITIVHYPENSDDLRKLWVILQAVQASLQMVRDLDVYLSKLLEKLVAVLPGKLLDESGFPVESLILQTPGGKNTSLYILGCLTLAKMYNYLKPDLVFSLAQFSLAPCLSNNASQNYDEQYLFQLFKCFGLLLQNYNFSNEQLKSVEFQQLLDKLYELIVHVNEKTTTGTAADQAVKNNCTFLCGVLVNKFSSFWETSEDSFRLNTLKCIIKKATS
ncbi:hypothetical protein ACO0QE_002374 [Hanseniaspora vineae]